MLVKLHFNDSVVVTSVGLLYLQNSSFSTRFQWTSKQMGRPYRLQMWGLLSVEDASVPTTTSHEISRELPAHTQRQWEK